MKTEYADIVMVAILDVVHYFELEGALKLIRKTYIETHGKISKNVRDRILAEYGYCDMGFLKVKNPHVNNIKKVFHKVAKRKGIKHHAKIVYKNDGYWLTNPLTPPPCGKWLFITDRWDINNKNSNDMLKQVAENLIYD